ncbi:hypothetical protein C8Q74DRAFT_1374251 [Fomes fomentarius]|nr:hypothetical protein C8Q74DRAFT_1374251 [Fomes fomentarius]
MAIPPSDVSVRTTSALTGAHIQSVSLPSKELEESKDIFRDILLLTSVMTGCREGASIPSPPSQPLALLNNLAFIINTGHPTRDPAGNRVVAVTGHIDSEGIKTSR